MRRRSQGPGISFFAFQDIISAVVGIFILIALLLVLQMAERVESAAQSPAIDLNSIRETIAAVEEETEQLQREYDTRLAAQQESSGLNTFNREARIAETQAAVQSAADRLETTIARLEDASARLAKARQQMIVLQQEFEDLEDERALLAELRGKLKRLDSQIQDLEVEDPLIYRDTTVEGRSVVLILIDGLSVQLRDAGTRKVHDWSGLTRQKHLRDWIGSVDLTTRHLLLLIRPGGAHDYEVVRETLSDADAHFGFDVIPRDQPVRLSFEIEAGT